MHRPGSVCSSEAKMDIKGRAGLCNRRKETA